MIRVGIVGIGGFAAQHWRNLEEVQRSGACRIVATAVVDPENHPARLQELRGRGVEVFDSPRAMYEAMRGRMEAVSLPTPIPTHAELMIAAVQSGYHVYLEKPPAATIGEHDEMAAAARRHNRLCAIGFQDIWSQSMALLKLRVSEGALGAVQRICCAGGWIRLNEYFDRASWRGRIRLGDGWVLAGTANNAMAHQIADMLYLASPERRAMATPAAVRAELYAAHDITAEDTAAIEIFTREGPRLYFAATLCADEQFDPELTLLAEKAAAYRSHDGRVCIRYNDGRVEEPQLDDTRKHVAKFENFIAACAANDADMLLCSLQMCRPFTLAVNGAFESARRVRRIPSEYVLTGGEGPAAKTVIRGIDAAICEAASRGVLFSELNLPWAHPTATFDLTGYERFGVQFESASDEEPAEPDQLPFG